MSDTPSDDESGAASADSFDALLAAAVGPPEEEGYTRLSPGETIGGRFVVEHHAGEGGMGAVYRCRDADSGSLVALKIMRSLDDRHASRFKREASILALLSHPAIVRYVAHGHTDAGLPYLAMEWLAGEDLGQRLRRERLTLFESIGLARRLCEGLAVAHARGFVHRDIKPSNIFLPERRIAAAKLLDFGLARGNAPTQTLTRAGTVLGTAGYMSPEQAAGTATLDGRADLFSLGCVLFECLTGQAAFAGEHGVAVLEKVLRGEVPRASALCPAVSAELDALVSSLLAKNRDERPESALEVARQLQRIEAQQPFPGHADEPTRAGPRSPLLATVLVGLGQTAGAASVELAEALGRCVERFAVQPMLPRDGSALLLLSADQHCPGVDRAARALACARSLQQRFPELAFALGSGLVEDEAGLVRGSALDCALAQREAALRAPSGLAVDALTSALLATGRSVQGLTEPVCALQGPPACSAANDVTREQERCYGRDKELSLLEATLDECITDGVSRAVLITGESGLGKSALARAFLYSLRARGEPCAWAVPAEFSERAEPFAYIRRVLAGAEALHHAELATCEAQLTRACLDELAKHQQSALVLIIDDAQWLDCASLQGVARTLHALCDRPLLVVGLARLELRAELRALWSSMRPEELRLRPLTDRAAEKLRFSELGASSGAALEHGALHAERTPRLLVALCRALLDHGSELSELSIALTQERLIETSATLRALLCSASVFGERFWVGAIEALHGDATNVLAGLRLLEEQQLLVARSGSRFQGEREYAFAHPLLRAAAYRLLSHEGRRQAHALATRWLLDRCAPDDALLRAQREAAREADA